MLVVRCAFIVIENAIKTEYTRTPQRTPSELLMWNFHQKAVAPYIQIHLYRFCKRSYVCYSQSFDRRNELVEMKQKRKKPNNRKDFNNNKVDSTLFWICARKIASNCQRMFKKEKDRQLPKNGMRTQRWDEWTNAIAKEAAIAVRNKRLWKIMLLNECVRLCDLW